MYKIRWSTRFKRDIKRCERQHKDMDKFKNIHEMLKVGEPLPQKNYDHLLTGNWGGHRECHLEPDWLLIYYVFNDKKEIEYIRMGSHSELFG